MVRLPGFEETSSEKLNETWQGLSRLNFTRPPAPRPRPAKRRVPHGGGEPKKPGKKEEGPILDAELVAI
jgi:hypothetical protein